MVTRSTMLRMIVLLVALPGCERFAHPKYDPPQYASGGAISGGTGGGAGGGSVSSSVGAPGDDITVPGCGVVAGGVGGGGEGTPCTAANDCAIVCCSCNGNSATGGEWSAASCVGGFCAGQPTTCGRTSACGGGVVLVGGGSSDACGGGSYADPNCDACMRASCCLEEAACANNPQCGAVEGCVSSCSDSECVSSCEAVYGSSSDAANLEACFADACLSACQ